MLASELDYLQYLTGKENKRKKTTKQPNKQKKTQQNQEPLWDAIASTRKGLHL